MCDRLGHDIRPQADVSELPRAARGSAIAPDRAVPLAQPGGPLAVSWSRAGRRTTRSVIAIFEAKGWRVSIEEVLFSTAREAGPLRIAGIRARPALNPTVPAVVNAAGARGRPTARQIAAQTGIGGA